MMTSRKNFCYCLLVLTISSSHISQASEILEAHVENEDDHYRIHLDMLVNAPFEQVYFHLTHYAKLTLLSKTIKQSTVLQQSPPQFRVKVISQGCIMFICKTVTLVQDVEEFRNGYIVGRVIPELSDFLQGYQFWHIRKQGMKTRVTYSADMVPDFFVPPLFGSYIFQKRMLKEGQIIINNAEKLAQQDVQQSRTRPAEPVPPR